MKIKKKILTYLLIISGFVCFSTNTNAEVYKYYNKLNGNQKKAYKKMEKKIDAAVSAPLSVKLKSNYLDVIRSIEAMSADRADLFSGNVAVSFESRGNITKVKFPELNGKKLSKKLRDFVDNTNLRGADDFETAKNIHDFIINHMEYDFSSDDSLTDKFSMKGALLNKKAVCEGYARTFKYMCDKYDMPCVLVTGIGTNPLSDSSDKAANERHMWNYLKLDNSWYAVDTTWDDNLSDETGICYDYFLVGSDTEDSINTPFYKSHIRNSTFFNFDVDNVKGFNYPELSKESFFGNYSNIYEYLQANYQSY